MSRFFEDRPLPHLVENSLDSEIGLITSTLLQLEPQTRMHASIHANKRMPDVSLNTVAYVVLSVSK